MWQRLKHKIFGCSIIFLCAFGLVSLLSDSTFSKEIEARTWDWRLRFFSSYDTPDPNIKMILLDQESLEYGVKNFGVYWPWPRQMYEAVIKFLEIGKAKGAAFDILFTEQTSQNIDDDRDFIEAVSGRLPIVTALSLNQTQSSATDTLLEEFTAIQNKLITNNSLINSLTDKARWPTYNSATLPFKELLESAKHFGNVTASPDSDGIFRHTVPLSYLNNTPILSLPFALIASDSIIVPPDWSKLLTSESNLVIKYKGKAKSYKTYHISDIVQSYANINQDVKPIINPDEFKNSYVFIGMSAPGLMDLKPSPLDERFPGVEVNATIADNLLNGGFVKKIGLLSSWLFAICSSLIALVIVFFITNFSKQIFALISAFALILAVPIVATNYNQWWPLFLPGSAFIFSLVLSYLYQYYYEGRQHRFIKDAFKYYVSPDVINQIVSNPKVLSLGGERRELTIFFSDIEGFTSIAEKISVAQVSELLNIFLSEMTAIIHRNGGTVDKYMGDAIVAFWNAPLPDQNHAYLGVKAALECQQRLNELQDEFQKNYETSLKMRIGIHTGVVSVGNFGSKDRFAYTIVGDAANLASRIEGTNKAFGTYVLISEDTFNKLDNNSISARKIGAVKVVGRKDPVVLYEPFLRDHDSDLESLSRSYKEGLGYLESGDLDSALNIFSGINSDSVARLYIKKIELIKSGQQKDLIWNILEK